MKTYIYNGEDIIISNTHSKLLISKNTIFSGKLDTNHVEFTTYDKNNLPINTVKISMDTSNILTENSTPYKTIKSITNIIWATI